MTSLYSHYQRLLECGDIAHDPAQEAVIVQLSSLHTALKHYTAAKKRALPFLAARITTPRGIYIHGGVGQGKSMMMDLFFTHAPIAKKRRVHFHEFMLEIHARLHHWRQKNQHRKGNSDPIPPLAKAIAHQCQLLCFDELQVTDITDAMILGRLFQALLKENVIIVATSNRIPDDLYKDGLQRDRFTGFIELLKTHMQVVGLAAAQDYRLAQLKSLKTMYYTPLCSQADSFITESFAQLTHHAPTHSAVLMVQGRELIILRATDKIALFSFAELCEKPLGAADYIALSEKFTTLVIKDIPKLTAEYRNEAKRFVTLIDALYEHHVKLLCSAEAAPHLLYTEGTGAFEFERTASRLIEMQSERYLALPHLSFSLKGQRDAE